jgi:hypothetical protein
MLRNFFGPVWGPIYIFFGFIASSAAFILISSQVQHHLPDFIALAAITFAVLYSFLFLIAPELAHDRGLEAPGFQWLAPLLIFGFVITSILISYYAERTFLADPPKICSGKGQLYAVDPPQLCFGVAKEVKSETAPPFDTSYAERLLTSMFGQRVSGGLEIVRKIHFFLFASVFTIIDLLFVFYAPRGIDRRKFRLIFLAVDVPIIIAVVGTLFLRWALEAEDHFQRAETFESGAISFQLLSGSVAAYSIDQRLLLIRGVRKGRLWLTKHAQRSWQFLIQLAA